MATTFPPRRESELVPFSLNFKTKITATPTVFGLTAGQATTYGTKHDAFVSAWDVCQDPMTKSKGNVALKDAVKATLLDELRLLAGIVQRAPGTTNAMRVDLNLPERDLEPTPAPIPALPPLLEVVSVYGHNVRIKLKDATGERRGKPEFVDGAQVFSYVGENPPTLAQGWKPEGVVKKSTVIVEFADAVPAGAKVWITACWFNNRGLTGPACTPVVSAIGFQGALPFAA